jgi:hypothetical protein
LSSFELTKADFSCLRQVPTIAIRSRPPVPTPTEIYDAVEALGKRCSNRTFFNAA